MQDKLAHLLFPPKCTLCRKLLCDDEQDICMNCKAELDKLELHRRIRGAYFYEAFVVYPYEGKIKHALHKFKYGGRASVYRFFGRKMAEKITQRGINADIVTSVPCDPKRKALRGFDHTWLLASQISRHLNIPALKTLIKTGTTKPMYRLTLEERRANIAGMIRTNCDLKEIEGKHILLADDILTTGSTASECARALITAGAAKVTVIVAAAVSKSKGG